MTKLSIQTEDLLRVREYAGGKLAGAKLLQVEENDYRVSFAIIAPQELVGRRIYFARPEVEALLADSSLIPELRQ